MRLPKSLQLSVLEFRVNGIIRNQDDDKQVRLKEEIDRGMSDVREGRLTGFDAGNIIALGKKLAAQRAKSGSLKKRK
jgi:hypothetical protein